MEKIQKTAYGKKRKGRLPFVIIAPHGAGDDLKTGVIASRLSRQMDAYLVLNNKFCKKSNTKKNKKIEDFNKLSWSYTKKKYLWGRKKKEMKTFFDDISEYCDLARQKSPFKKALGIYIHGFVSDTIAIDLGVGAKKNIYTDFIYGAKAYNFIHKNNGKITMRISLLKKLKKNLSKNMVKENPSKISIGKHYSGWSKTSAIQFHKHEQRDDYAVQMEISHLLRKNNKQIDNTVEIIKKSLTESFL
ncbi:MAG: hypothetical protein GF349_02650 [Candidatus Magasanikbacteria bacterium]|nr:hypothetical protein [Candidatus Magasanikbacteria bacterium]